MALPLSADVGEQHVLRRTEGARKEREHMSEREREREISKREI